MGKLRCGLRTHHRMWVSKPHTSKDHPELHVDVIRRTYKGIKCYHSTDPDDIERGKSQTNRRHRRRASGQPLFAEDVAHEEGG